MRLIGHVQGEASARKFGDYLLVQGIENNVEPDKDGSWAVWIHAEDDLDKAKSFLAAFLEKPADAGFTNAARSAQLVREQKEQDRLAYEKRLKSRRHLFRPLTGYGFGPVTFVLICASVVVFILSNFGLKMEQMHNLFISEVDVLGLARLDFWGRIARRWSLINQVLPEVHQGQVWRLFTPVLLHFDIWHILFNMWCLRDFGSMIEGRQNSLVFAALVFVLAVVPNVAQYLVSGPLFGGMSGVVYGLLGYIWLRGKFDPGSGLGLHPSTVQMAIVWLLLGFTGYLGVANTVHGTGLALGMLWGWLSSLRHR